MSGISSAPPPVPRNELSSRESHFLRSVLEFSNHSQIIRLIPILANGGFWTLQKAAEHGPHLTLIVFNGEVHLFCGPVSEVSRQVIYLVNIPVTRSVLAGRRCSPSPRRVMKKWPWVKTSAWVQPRCHQCQPSGLQPNPDLRNEPPACPPTAINPVPLHYWRLEEQSVWNNK